MARAKPALAAAPRRSGRVAEATTPALPVEDKHRIAKPIPPRKPPRRPCTTCDRTFAASAFYKLSPTKKCNHEINTCKSCLKSWLTTQLEFTTYDKLSCPECSEILQHADVRKYASKDTYAKYDQMERRAYQDQTPGWRWCLAPDCRAGQVHAPLLDDGAQAKANADAAAARKQNLRKSTTSAAKTPTIDKPDILTCETCGARACVPCDRPYHDGETCSEHQARLERQQGEEEAASLAQIKAACKPCPKCKKNIEKNGGCDAVGCTQCGDLFCWLCATSYTVINQSGHAKGCTYAAPDRFDPHAAQGGDFWANMANLEILPIVDNGWFRGVLNRAHAAVGLPNLPGPARRGQ